MLRSGLASESGLVWRLRPQKRFVNISDSLISTCSICIDKFKRCILKQHISPKIDMQSYPVTLKNGKCPQNIKHYISILMIYLYKFGHNISTRCSDKLQISFFLPWVGYFDIVLGMEKSSHICI